MSKVLLHIGYPKSGSKYLQEWFLQHPSIFFNHRSVTGFYESHDISRYAEDKSAIHDCFVLSCEELSSWKGDVDIVGMKNTRMYDVVAYQNKLAATLKSVYPLATILIVTRGYRTFFTSMFNEILAKGGVLNYRELQNMYGEFFQKTYDYSMVIKLYRDTFGKENVLVLPHELLRKDPSAFTKMIEEKTGIKNSFTIPPEKINASFAPQTLAAYRRFSNFVFKAVSPFPYTLQKFVYANYIHWLNKRKPNPYLEFLGKYTNPEDMAGLEETILSMKGKAELLRHEELYQPYLKEYLL